MALLIEHYKGHWPFWLSPRQAILLTVGDNAEVVEKARAIAERLAAPGGLEKPRAIDAKTFTVDTDFTPRAISKKVSEAKRNMYNLVIVVGKRSLEEGTLEVDITGTPSREEAVITVVDVMARGTSTLENLRAVKLSEAQVSELMLKLSGKYL